MTPNVIAEFLDEFQESIVGQLNKNQGKLSLQKDVRESKKYQEVVARLRDLDSAYFRVKETISYRDRVWDTLRNLKTPRSKMTQFLEKGREIYPHESQAVQETLEPFLFLLQPIEEICQLQGTMANNAKLRKMPLPYDEIHATLNGVKVTAEKLPEKLHQGVHSMWQSLEQAA
jgi:hypothetical protein